MKHYVYLLMMFMVSLNAIGQKRMVLDTNAMQTLEADAQSGLNRVVSFDGTYILIKYTIPEIELVECADGKFKYSVAGFYADCIDGYSYSLTRLERFDIGQCQDAEVKVLDSKKHTLKIDVAPYSEYSLDGSVCHANAMAVSEVFSKELVGKIDIKTFRESNILEFELSPVWYDTDNQELIVNNEFWVKIHIDVDAKNLSQSIDRVDGESYFTKLQDIAKHGVTEYSNGGIVSYDNPNIKEFDNEATLLSLDIQYPTFETYKEFVSKYLIVTVDDFVPNLQEFARWKRMMGFNVSIVSREKYKSPNEVESDIQAYYSENPELEYVLVVGGSSLIPAFKEKFYEPEQGEFMSVYTDVPFYYRSEDVFPFAYYGRIPADNKQELSSLLQNIIEYEKLPTLSSDYYQSALLCSYFQDFATGYDDKSTRMSPDGYEDRRFVETAENIASLLNAKNKSVDRVYTTERVMNPRFYNNTKYSNGGNLPNFLLRSNGFNWDGTTRDLVDKFDSNFFVLYFGHGTRTDWNEIGLSTDYDTSDISATNHPVVFSITCSTGAYNGTADFLAKHFMKSQSYKASCVIAASQFSSSGYNDVFAYSMFDAVWPRTGLKPYFGDFGTFTPTSGYRFGEHRIGNIFELGMRKVEELCPVTYKKYTRNVFQLFGDPSCTFRTEVPQNGKELLTWRSNNTIAVSGINAITSVYNEKLDELKTYTNVVSLDVDDIDYCTICISGKNIVPYIVEGAKTSMAPSKILGFENLGGGQYFINYHVTPGNGLSYLTYTPIYPISTTKVYPINPDGELLIEVDSSVAEFAVQLIVDGVAVDTLRIRAKSTM